MRALRDRVGGVPTNWTGDQVFTPRRVVKARTREELAELIAAAGRPGSAEPGSADPGTAEPGSVRVVGSRHSFNDSAATPGTMIEIGALDRVLEADPGSGLVRVEAGITVSQLGRELDRRGLALENLGDIDRQTIAGAISTGTHGTGARFGSISSQVEAAELVLADGSVREVGPGQAAGSTARELGSDAEGHAELDAARVSIGALGALSTVTLRCLPAFSLHRVDRPCALEGVLGEFDRLASANDHFEFFVFPHTRRALTIERNRTDRPPRPRGPFSRFLRDELLENAAGDLAMRAVRRRPALIPRMTALVASVMSQGDQIDRADRVFANLRRIRFTEMEYALPREAGPEAIEAVLGLIERERFPVPMPIECRVAAAESAMLSPAHGRDTTYVAVHQYQGMPWREYFDAVEEVMRSLGGRPHWGKRHSRTAADLAPDYPRWDEFRAARDRLDPGRLFGNRYVRRVLGP